jgi:hypothetical protein
MTVRDQNLQTIGFQTATFKIHQTTNVDDLKDADIGKAVSLSGNYAAYTGLRVELAAKAEARYVDQLDVRLARLEATINERFATKDDLSGFKNEMVAKLSAIETILATQKNDREM